MTSSVRLPLATTVCGGSTYTLFRPPVRESSADWPQSAEISRVPVQRMGSAESKGYAGSAGDESERDYLVLPATKELEQNLPRASHPIPQKHLMEYFCESRPTSHRQSHDVHRQFFHIRQTCRPPQHPDNSHAGLATTSGCHSLKIHFLFTFDDTSSLGSITLTECLLPDTPFPVLSSVCPTISTHQISCHWPYSKARPAGC